MSVIWIDAGRLVGYRPETPLFSLNVMTLWELPRPAGHTPGGAA